MTTPVQVGPSTNDGPTPDRPQLTDREHQILERVANGATYKQLAREWGYAEVTVRGMGAVILRKMGAQSIAHAVFLACRTGLLDGRPERHGDHAGFAAHQRRGEEPCAACRAGERAYRAERHAARRAAKFHAA